ncbi:MAG: prepilin-type N-terminal cleavage/methylation domain-containing protein [Gammaproteobacteria bacterium]|nr:prepilin-type N-terminal cleavage/methylation domain-containing protein [Gammaproteobacteria bacterium]
MTYPKPQSGFTLVEIIIVIAIMGIIGGLASMVIGRSLDAYAALERRTNMQTSIRLAVERISRELRHALPNSICVNNGVSCVADAQNRFYFIPVKDSGRYQDRPGVYYPGQTRDRLGVAPQSRNRFDVLSTNNTNRINAAVGINGDWVAVYNLDNSTVYPAGNNIRHQINAIIQKDIHNTPGNTNDDIDQIQFSGNVSFTNHSPSRRFHIIDNQKQVTLFYLNGTNLFRDTTTFSNPNTATGNSRLLMENVQACTFTYTPGSQQRAGLLRIDITVAEQGETIQVIHDAHVYNTP